MKVMYGIEDAKRLASSLQELVQVSGLMGWHSTEIPWVFECELDRGHLTAEDYVCMGKWVVRLGVGGEVITDAADPILRVAWAIFHANLPECWREWLWAQTPEGARKVRLRCRKKALKAYQDSALCASCGHPQGEHSEEPLGPHQGHPCSHPAKPGEPCGCECKDFKLRKEADEDSMPGNDIPPEGAVNTDKEVWHKGRWVGPGKLVDGKVWSGDEWLTPVEELKPAQVHARWQQRVVRSASDLGFGMLVASPGLVRGLIHPEGFVWTGTKWLPLNGDL